MRNPLRIAVPVVLAAVVLGGCLVGGRGEVRLRAPVAVALVTVEPGVQVIEDYHEEVFYVDGQYWVRRSDYWYRSSDPHAHWSLVETRSVPVVIVSSPRGRYKHWKGNGHDRGEHRGDDRRAGERHDKGRHGG